MTLWLADFRVEGKLVLPDGHPTIEHVAAYDRHRISLSNAPESDRTGKEALSLQVYLQADDIEDAEASAAEIAKAFLATLSFVTSHGFRLGRKRFLMDWTPGLNERQTIVYWQDNGWDQSPELTSQYVGTIREIESSPDFVALQRAIRWYSAGTRSELMEDQFQYFWFAIELLADINVSKLKVRDKCSCGGDLTCDVCGKPSEHRPFPKQRIDALLKKVNLSAEIRKDLFRVRNGIMHGDSRDEIEADLRKRVPEFEFQNAVDKIGGAAFMTLFNAMKIRKNQISRVTFGAPDTYVAQTAVARFHMILGTLGDPNNPRFEDVVLPTVTAERVPMPITTEN